MLLFENTTSIMYSSCMLWLTIVSVTALPIYKLLDDDLEIVTSNDELEIKQREHEEVEGSGFEPERETSGRLANIFIHQYNIESQAVLHQTQIIQPGQSFIIKSPAYPSRSVFTKEHSSKPTSSFSLDEKYPYTEKTAEIVAKLPQGTDSVAVTPQAEIQTTSPAPVTTTITPATMASTSTTTSTAPPTTSIAPSTTSKAPPTTSIVPTTTTVTVAQQTTSISSSTTSLATPTTSLAPATTSIASATTSAAPPKTRIVPTRSSIVPAASFLNSSARLESLVVSPKPIKIRNLIPKLVPEIVPDDSDTKPIVTETPATNPQAPAIDLTDVYSYIIDLGEGEFKKIFATKENTDVITATEVYNIAKALPILNNKMPIFDPLPSNIGGTSGSSENVAPFKRYLNQLSGTSLEAIAPYLKPRFWGSGAFLEPPTRRKRRSVSNRMMRVINHNKFNGGSSVETHDGETFKYPSTTIQAMGKKNTVDGVNLPGADVKLHNFNVQQGGSALQVIFDRPIIYLTLPHEANTLISPQNDVYPLLTKAAIDSVMQKFNSDNKIV